MFMSPHDKTGGCKKAVSERLQDVNKPKKRSFLQDRPTLEAKRSDAALSAFINIFSPPALKRRFFLRAAIHHWRLLISNRKARG
jgi:hypothetical protein